MLRKLPPFALIAAPLLGVFCILGLYYSDRLLPTIIRRDWQFFLLNGGLMVMLNWRLRPCATLTRNTVFTPLAAITTTISARVFFSLP